MARKLVRVTELHGERRTDDYFWLRDKADPAVIAYLEAENAYAAGVLGPTRGLQETLYQEMLGRIQETDQSVPYREGEHLYYSRTEEGRQYRIHCRKHGSLEAPEQVLLDLNALAEGESFMALGAFAVSDDGRLLAYSTDNKGFREYTLRIKDLASGELLAERIERTDSVAWAADGTLFYTVEDAAKRPYRLYRHTPGASQAELVYEERDEMFRLYVHRTRSRDLILLYSASHTTSECRLLPAGGAGEWTLVESRRQDHEYDVHHHGEHLYIRTNDRGRNFRLVRAPLRDPRRERWEEVVPYRPDVMLEDVALFRRHLVLSERAEGLPRLRVRDLRSGETHSIEFPEPAYSVAADENPEFDSTTFRYRYESLVTPVSIFDWDMERREARLLKRTPVLGGYDPARYRIERFHATATDGARIPVSLVSRTDRAEGRPAPLLLYGYGAYGFPLPVSFSSNRVSLLDRGMLFALAHVRGGGELGKPWHDQGRLRAKRNTFTDFIAVAEHLIAEGYTSSERLVIEGGSAGGLLVGAVINMRPDLFGMVVAKVPFVDVLNTMLDASLPLTVGEYEEWGDPRRREDYDYIRSYCPYSNLEAKDYPAMLVKTSLHDSQVMYWEPAKYVARLRALKTDRNPLLLKTNTAAGHGGASGRYDYLREVALDYAFILTRLDLA